MVLKEEVQKIVEVMENENLSQVIIYANGSWDITRRHINEKLLE